MYLYPFQKADYSAGMNPGPGQGGPSGPPCPALIHQLSNSGIEIPSTEVKAGEEARIAVAKLIQQLPGRLRKKMFAIRSRIEWMVEKYGIEHVGLQTLTIRENVTDRKDFTRRFKSLATNVFPKIYEDWLRVFERQQRGAWHAHVVVVTKEDIRTGCNVAALNQLFKDNKEHKITKGAYYAGIHRLASPNLPGHLEGVPAVVRRAGVQSTAQIQGPAVLQVRCLPFAADYQHASGDGDVCLQIHRQDLREPKGGRQGDAPGGLQQAGCPSLQRAVFLGQWGGKPLADQARHRGGNAALRLVG